ncbi:MULTISPECIES: hypothetical protein [unclassified Streptomyces]|uniref:hypothetical protein n=1 Tax=unclassified Streptomyces TaxID=2593676 RepID=UPI002B1CEF4E|nr:MULTISPECIES: hypothetical protein [unclassified Streptomyces]
MYAFLYLHAGGDQLRQITARLVDQGVVRTVARKVSGFGQTPQAMQPLAHGGVRGKPSHHRQLLIPPRPRRATQTAHPQQAR